jgi:hypothetical protein
MKKTFDELCNSILREENSDTNKTSTVPLNPSSAPVQNGSTKPVTPSTTPTPQPTQTPASSSLKPEDVLKALTQIDPNHPELHTFLDNVTKAIAEKQKQANYNQQNAAQ